MQVARVSTLTTSLRICVMHAAEGINLSLRSCHNLSIYFALGHHLEMLYFYSCRQDVGNVGHGQQCSELQLVKIIVIIPIISFKLPVMY